MKHSIVAAGIIVIAGLALYLSHSLILRYVVKRQVRARIGKNTNIELSGVEITGNGVLLKKITIKRPGVAVEIPSLSIAVDPWKYLFGRKVLDRVEVDFAKVRVTIDAMKRHYKTQVRYGGHGRRAIFNHLVLKDFSVLIKNKGREISRVKGRLKMDKVSGHGLSLAYNALGSLDINDKKNDYHGKLKGVYSFSGNSDMVLAFDAPLRVPFRAGTVIIKEIRLRNRGLDFPSCGLELSGMNIDIRDLSVKIANTGVFGLLTQKGFPRNIREIKAGYAAIHILDASDTDSDASVPAVKPATDEQDLKHTLMTASALLNKKLDRIISLNHRLFDRALPKISILSLDIIKKSPVLSNISLFFDKQGQNGWSLTAKGKKIRLAIDIKRSDNGLISNVSWHLSDSRALAMVLPGIGPDCGLDLRIRAEYRHAAGWSSSIDIKAGPLTVDQPLLCEDPVHFNSLSVDGNLSYDPINQTLDFEKGSLGINGIKTALSARISLSRQPSVHVKYGLSRIKATDLLRGLPSAMTNRISGIKFAGTFAFRVSLALDLDDLSKSHLFLKPDISNLKIVSVPRYMDISNLSGNFIQTIHTDDDEIKRKIGPDSPDWVPLDDIPAYFIDCLLSSEDGTFFRHSGFYPPAIRDSLIADLTQHKIVRGASTISQQLTKNLFLSKSKSLSRKLQEAVLTWYLESNLSKQRILELYLNIIEWGPHIYGIHQASMHYFGKAPSDLDLAESAFLVTIIPSPLVWHKKCIRLKRVPKVIKSKITRLLRILKNKKIIDEDEIDAAMDEFIEFNTETMGLSSHHPSSSYRGQQK